MTTTNPPDLALAVPRGFEDIACKDILRFTSPQSTHFQLDTGFVRLKTGNGSTFSSIIEAYATGKLWSATRCLICLHDQPIVIPKDLELRLVEKRKSLPSKRSRVRAAAVEKQEDIKKPALGKLERTESEDAYIAFLQDTIRSSAAQFDAALKAWNTHAHLRERDDTLSLSFAVRMDRRDFLFPTLKSLDIERSVGSAFWELLEDHIDSDNIRVSLDNPDLEIILEHVRNPDTLEWSIMYALALPLPHHPPSHRSGSRVHGRTALLPERAYCLCSMHPAITERTSASNILFDPCSGLGSIPIELAAIIRRDMLRLTALSADNERPSLEGASKNTSCSGVGVPQGTPGIDAGILWDGRGQPFSSGFREGVLGGVISDLPWGLRELSVNAVSRLYPALLKRLGDACSDGAFAVFLLHRDRVFLTALQQNSSKWKYVSRRPVDVNGAQAHVFVIRRVPRSSQTIQSVS